MAALNHSIDPTLAALDALHEQASGSDAPRRYLGASAIGDPCARKIWYGFRHAMPRSFPASSYRAIQDGHRGEALMIQWLRSIPGIQLWTEDPDQPGQQIGFTALSGHHRGNLDGIISGLYQDPATPHVWEMKVCNEKKWDKLVKLILKHGEKAALKVWDEIYYAQAQDYMHHMQLTHHYLTVATPGKRKLVSCRTEYCATDAKAILKKAETIIAAERPPLRLSDNPAWYQCKWCDYHTLCHGQAMPAVNCRTCAHSTARLDESQPWTCELNQPEICGKQAGCDRHAYHPDLVANHGEAIGADMSTGTITFRLKDGSTVQNGLAGLKSREWRAQATPVATPVIDDILEELATESAIPAQELESGQIDEQQWPTVYQSGIKLFEKFESNPDKTKRLINLLGVIDSAYLALIERAAI